MTNTADQLPTAKPRSGVYLGHHPPDGSAWGECTRCETMFDDLDQLDAHMDTEHPYTCSRHQCDILAAYRTAPGSGLSGATYCREHVSIGGGGLYQYTWVLASANDDAPRLDEDHPLEQAMRGLFGSRSAAQSIEYEVV